MFQEKRQDGTLHIEAAKMVVDYAELGELRRWIKKNREKIDENHICVWLYQIADAMAYLEHNKIVHRDLAARNILLQDSVRKLFIF